MVKPRAQSKAEPRTRRSGPQPIRSDGATTRARVLEAAWNRLATVGYAQLNLRDIAREAGVNHALINYHFRSKQALVLEVLDETNRRLLERQSRMYATPQKPSEKWQQACDFYEDDLRSGFVRVQMELLAASYSDEALRRDFLPKIFEWLRVVHRGVEDTIGEFGIESPFPARVISTWISAFWWGMESIMVTGVTEDEMPFREALAAMTQLLQLLEKKSSTRRRT